MSTVVYSETEGDRNSVVVAVVRDGTTDLTNFKSLRNKNACFPEYGGIAWLSFVMAARQNGAISNSCDYPKAVSKFLNGACTPGYMDDDHGGLLFPGISPSLCNVCPKEPNGNSCSANSSNMYYGDEGALECLDTRAGDFAIIEARNLRSEDSVV